MEKRQRMTLLGIALAIAGVVAVIALVSSGGDDSKDDSTSNAATATQPGTTTQADTTPSPPPKPEPERIEIKAGKPVDGVREIQLNKNERAEIEVAADEELAIHFHGYDIEKPAAPGDPAVFKFTAKNEGVFEIEVESTATKVAEVTVKP